MWIFSILILVDDLLYNLLEGSPNPSSSLFLASRAPFVPFVVNKVQQACMFDQLL